MATSCIEETEAEHKTSGYTNTIAKDINKFRESIKNNGGYYIARYEAGDSNSTSNRTSSSSQTVIPVFKENQIVYNHITQPNAATLVRNLYNNQTKNYESDLINSYAWDTAIVFIQEFSGDEDYSIQNAIQDTLAKTGLATDGTNKDVRCNIHDMSGNVYEWTTETDYNTSHPQIYRGGYYNNHIYYTSNRYSYSATGYSSPYVGWRRNFIYVSLIYSLENIYNVKFYVIAFLCRFSIY